MSIMLEQLTARLDVYLDSANFEDRAINGIQVMNNVAIHSVATAVTSSLEVIEKARDLKVQALIVHHGIFCKGDAYPISGIKYKKIKLLIENNIALVCYHLPLDAHKEVGNNWKAARDLGLKNLKPWFKFYNTEIGVLGSIEPTKFEELEKIISTYYQNKSNVVKVKDTITSIGILSGGAHKFIDDAALALVDCFITGTVDEPVWDSAHEKNISFIGMGHYATETVGPIALAEYIKKELNISATFIKTANPF